MPVWTCFHFTSCYKNNFVVKLLPQKTKICIFLCKCPQKLYKFQETPFFLVARLPPRFYNLYILLPVTDLEILVRPHDPMFQKKNEGIFSHFVFYIHISCNSYFSGKSIHELIPFVEFYEYLYIFVKLIFRRLLNCFVISMYS